jgi:hypothetical protein
MNIPIDLKSSIDVNSVNLAKMTPTNKKNVVFKFSIYRIPWGLPSKETRVISEC